MFSAAAGPYSVRCDTQVSPGRYHLTVQLTDTRAVCVDVSGSLDPAAVSGFLPGAAFALETQVLFFGAGSRIWAYALPSGKQLWQEDVTMGFLRWARHADVVIMSGVLELAAWDLRGHKLWSTHVEPGWKYSVEGQTVTLEVMGKPYDFALRHGP